VNRISLNVIAYNEEDRLGACLDDARPYVDEIVVVDQMSTDGTAAIAQSRADVYVQDIHHGHAEPSRELAALRSSGEWLLILDADELLSDALKGQLRTLVAGDIDGYWIRKANYVDGQDTGSISHYRLVRKSRVRFDPGPHGGAVAVSDNVGYFDDVGIIHEKTLDEQLYDDARYERIALEDPGATTSKRNWLQHNIALRAERARQRRTDLEALVPDGDGPVAVIGGARVTLTGRHVIKRASVNRARPDAPYDAVIINAGGREPIVTLRDAAQLVAPGGVLVGTIAASRNRRRLEVSVDDVLRDRADPTRTPAATGATRREVRDVLTAGGLDVRSLTLLRDGWLDPVALRPNGNSVVIESDAFLLKRVAAEVAEELTAEEIVFAAVREPVATSVACSVVVAELAGAKSTQFVRALRAERSRGVEVIVVTEDSVPARTTMGARYNAGARDARGAVIVFVPADAVYKPGWLDALLDAHASRVDAGATGSKVVTPAGTIEHAGLAIGFEGTPYRIYHDDPATAPNVNRFRVVPAVAATGMAVTRQRFVDVGGFDESLGDDLADADLCLRLRSRGWRVLFAPAAVLTGTRHALPGASEAYLGSAREFAARWNRAPRSDEILCRTDGRDLSDQRNRAWRLPVPAAPAGTGLPAVAWSSHYLEWGGYTEEAITAVEALDDAGLRVVANSLTWRRKGPARPREAAARLAELLHRDLPEDFVHVAHVGAHRFKRHHAAHRNIGRTMYETDGLPADWVQACNNMDEIWVPCAHNLHSFANAGVDPAKLHRVPETYDATVFRPGAAALDVDGLSGFVFLSVFSWGTRKAWDVLLRAWHEEFSARDDVTLLLKTDTDNAPGTDCRAEVDLFVRGHLKLDPDKGPRIVVLDRALGAAEMPSLYATASAFVLPSHGEGWGRPYMESMAMGVPAIATRWSGHLDFMDDDNSYLVGYELVDAPSSVGIGQRWAAPSVKDVRRAMRRAYEHPDEAARLGKRAAEDVTVRCAPELLVAAVRDRLEATERHPVHVSVAAPLPPAVARPSRAGRRVTACVIVDEDRPSPARCVASVRDAADAVVVVEAAPGQDRASVRNAALDQASGGWVLMLDASETLDPASVRAVADGVARDEFVGFTARHVHQFGFDGAASVLEERRAVLFPRHPDLRFIGVSGDDLLPRRHGLSFQLVPTDIVVHQHGYRPERGDAVARARTDLPALERAVRDAPDEPFHRYQLGAALSHLGLEAEAEVALASAIDAARRDVAWLPAAQLELAKTFSRQGRWSDVVDLCKAATKLAPEWSEAWCARGDALFAAGRHKGARRAYDRCIAIARARMPLATVWRAQAGVGRIHLRRGEFDEAIDWLRAAVEGNPADGGVHLDLAQAYEAVGRSADARRELEQATVATHAGPEAFLAFGDFFMRKAEDALVRGLADHGENRALQQRIEQVRSARSQI
jgi:glycosyltransferase involved in cell wall biosynthesis/Flp pilus assembly protein TadD